MHIRLEGRAICNALYVVTLTVLDEGRAKLDSVRLDRESIPRGVSCLVLIGQYRVRAAS